MLLSCSLLQLIIMVVFCITTIRSPWPLLPRVPRNRRRARILFASVRVDRLFPHQAPSNLIDKRITIILTLAVSADRRLGFFVTLPYPIYPGSLMRRLCTRNATRPILVPLWELVCSLPYFGQYPLVRIVPISFRFSVFLTIETKRDLEAGS